MTDHALANAPMGEREFRELADNAPVMIWRSTPDKLCDWFNKPWQEYAGKGLDALVGYGWAEDVHPDDYDRCVATYVAAFDARESFTMPYRLRRHDGVYRWFLDNGAPYYRDGQFAGYFGSCIDITEQRELEEHQRVLLDELNHRVKNNLQLLLSFVQASQLGATTEEARRLLGAAISRIHAVGIIQDELYREQGGTADLSRYLVNIAQASAASQPEADVRLVTDTVPVSVPYETASPLGIIVNELITNAIRHGSAAGGRIWLALSVEEGRLTMRIADEGPGFPAEATQPQPRLGGNRIIDALARRCGATVERRNDNGAHVTVTLQLPGPGA